MEMTMRHLSQHDTLQISGGFPTLIEGYASDDLLLVGLAVGSFAAVGLGQVAHKYYGYAPLTVRETVSCVINTGWEGLKWGARIDIAYAAYTGACMLGNAAASAIYS